MILAKISDLLKKPMTRNFGALVLLQGVNYLLPLLSFPFLVRVLGVERWGLVSFGYTFIQYFVLFSDFGFNLSATKYISIHRDDEERINRYLNSAFICRIFLGLLGFILLLILISTIGRFRQDAAFYLMYFGIVAGNIMFPMWFFQGMEKMKYITIFNAVAKLISFIPFFIFIRKPDDYILVPLFYTTGYVFAGLISIYIIYFKERMKWFFPTLAEIKFAFRDSSTYFLSRISVSIFTYSNVFVLKLVCGNTAVGYYSAAEKLYQAYNQLLTPFTGVLFPHMAKTRDIHFFKKIFKRITSINIFLLIGLLLASYWIIQVIYGQAAQAGSLTVFRILLFGCFFTIPSILLGYPFLAAIGYFSYTNWTVFIVSLFHLLGLTLLFFSGYLTINTVAALVILAELLLFTFRARAIVHYKLFER
ncbi:MAG: oligosaccharide flippase family protein [Tannerellaceae bacterium]|jgi:PST family polysaccharide transporter|nr:oligosaccharide flippase family protein [Tannerellaceae bacterium]